MNAILEKIKDYFGLGLPPRELELEFSLPAISKRGKKPNLNSAKLEADFKEFIDQPSLLLDEIEAYLIRLNRYKVNMSQRTLVSNTCLKYFYPAMLVVFNKYRDCGGIPDSDEKTKEIAQTEKILALLIKSYKFIFQNDYDASNFFYSRYRDRVNFCALRLLELIYYRQRMLALRYILLEPSSWHAAHQIYGIISEYENAAKRHPVLSHELFKGKQSDKRRLQRKSVEEYYVAVQLYFIIDQLAWHTRALPFIDRYLSYINPPVAPARFTGGIVGVGETIVYYGQKKPPYYSNQKIKAPIAWTFNLAPLLVQLKLDRKALFYANAQQNEFLVPKFLKKILPEYRLPLIEGLTKFVFVDTPDYMIPSFVPYENIRIYSGMGEIFDKLKDVFYPNARNAGSRKFRDTMAQRSSSLSSDKDASEQSVWFKCGKEGPEKLCVKTMESQYTEHYHIGSLVLVEDYSQTPGKLTIGKVIKINRLPGDKYVQFSIRFLGTDALPVTMTSTENMLEGKYNSKLVLGAIMVTAPNKMNSLIIPFSKSYWYESDIIIFNNKQEVQARFAKVLDMSQDFYQFSLENETIVQKKVQQKK